MRVDVVSFLKVFKHVFKIDIHAFGDHFVGSSLCSDLVVRCHEYLQFGIREHCGADIPAIHDDSPALSELAQFAVHVCADFRNCGYRAYFSCYGKRADFFLYASVSDICAVISEVHIQICECFA